MSIQTLRDKGGQKSLSGRNKKQKKARKNILWIEDELDYKPTRILDPESNSKLLAMLKTVFLDAHITSHRQRRPREQANEENLMQAKLKRRQLLFGANVISKALQAGKVACTLFAHDISPEMLKCQLHTMCKTRNVPFLNVQKLREVTREALGFPCIVIGFRKDSTDFKSAIELITSMYNADEECKTQNNTQQDPGTSAGTSRKTEEKYLSSEDRKPFEYCYCDALTSKRSFIPEENLVPYRRFAEATKNSVRSVFQVKTETKPEPDLDAETETDTEPETEPKREKISVDPIRGQKRKLERDSTNDDEGRDFSFEYNVAKIIKLHGNPGREKKKPKKSMKNLKKVTEKPGEENASRK